MNVWSYLLDTCENIATASKYYCTADILVLYLYIAQEATQERVRAVVGLWWTRVIVLERLHWSIYTQISQKDDEIRNKPFRTSVGIG